MTTKKVLVTGGTGYIGSHTCVELCAAGYLPVVVDNLCASERHMLDRTQELCATELPFYRHDCRDEAAMLGVFDDHPDIVGTIHFAAHKSVGVSTRQPLEYHHNNVGSMLCLLRVLKQAQCPALVFSSSCTVYGNPDELPVTEATPMAPAASPYGRTKQICEQIIEDVSSAEPLQAVTLRYFNPIGAHPSGKIGELPLGKPETLVPYITQAAAGVRGELTVFGSDYPTPDGSCIRDYIHIVDLARAHVAALAHLESSGEASFHRVYNVGTGRGTSVLEAITSFEEATGVKVPYRIGPRRPGDVVQVYANVEKVERELSWKAELSVKQALADAYRWQLALAQ